MNSHTAVHGQGTDSQDPFTDLFARTNGGDPSQIRSVFSEHRLARQRDQGGALLRSGTVKPDPILADIGRHGEQVDERHCISIVARPAKEVEEAIAGIQERLRQLEKTLEIEGALWLTPLHMLHLTVLEWISNADEETVERAVEALKSKPLEQLTAVPDPPLALDTPALSYDASAMALSFLPFCPPAPISPPNYAHPPTYLHYRRSLYHRAAFLSDPCSSSSTLTLPQSRYTLPSAHITLARFVRAIPGEKVERLLQELDAIIEVVRQELEESLIWRIEGPLHVKFGRIWYGGGKALNPTM